MSADVIVSPTKWQKDQLPKSLAEKCHVVFDGIDENIYNDNEQSKEMRNNSIQILTYGTRGMEPMRCFPEFIQCLPKIIENQPNVRVEIAGQDEVHYGGLSPKGSTWKTWAINYLRENSCQDNIYWMGRLDERNYVEWLKRSDCHIYLTHPYVASWSLVESILCCRRIVASNVEPVREFHTESKMILVDHRSQVSLIDGILKQLSSSKVAKTPQSLVDRVKIDTCMAGWECLLDLDVEINEG